MRNLTLILAALIAITTLGLTACSGPSPAAVCAHIAEVMGEEASDEDLAECEEEMVGELEERCSNVREVLGCIMDAEDLPAFAGCEEVCDEVESEEEGEEEAK